jgi:hypothetical protein
VGEPAPERPPDRCRVRVSEWVLVHIVQDASLGWVRLGFTPHTAGC